MKTYGRRTAATAAVCAMMGALALGGTMAYLTDNEAHVNTFTVGNVLFGLQEPGWDPGAGGELVPNGRLGRRP